MACSTRVTGHRHLQGNVQAYVRIPGKMRDTGATEPSNSPTHRPQARRAAQEELRQQPPKAAKACLQLGPRAKPMAVRMVATSISHQKMKPWSKHFETVVFVGICSGIIIPGVLRCKILSIHSMATCSLQPIHVSAAEALFLRGATKKGRHLTTHVSSWHNPGLLFVWRA